MSDFAAALAWAVPAPHVQPLRPLLRRPLHRTCALVPAAAMPRGSQGRGAPQLSAAARSSAAASLWRCGGRFGCQHRGNLGHWAWCAGCGRDSGRKEFYPAPAAWERAPPWRGAPTPRGPSAPPAVGRADEPPRGSGLPPPAGAPPAAAAPADSFARHALPGVFIGAIELAFAVGFLSEGVSTHSQSFKRISVRERKSIVRCLANSNLPNPPPPLVVGTTRTRGVRVVSTGATGAWPLRGRPSRSQTTVSHLPFPKGPGDAAQVPVCLSVCLSPALVTSSAAGV